MTSAERNGTTPLEACAYCWHTADWHSHDGTGDCEHDAECGCKRFVPFCRDRTSISWEAPVYCSYPADHKGSHSWVQGEWREIAR